MLRWIFAYLFDCVHSHTTWPHQNRRGHAYLCCLDCGREMPYSLEYMQIIRQERKRNRWVFRSSARASLIIAGVLLLLVPSYAAGCIRRFSQSRQIIREGWSHGVMFPSVSSKSRAVSQSTPFWQPRLNPPAPNLPMPARAARPGFQPRSRNSSAALLVARHFAENAARFCRFFSFFSVVSGWATGCILLSRPC